MDQEQKAQAARIAAQIDRSIPPETPYLEKVGLMNNNRLEAEDQVVRVSSTSILPFQEQIAGHWADESGRSQFLTQAPPITLPELEKVNVDVRRLIEEAPQLAMDLLGDVKQAVLGIQEENRSYGIEETLTLETAAEVFWATRGDRFWREFEEPFWISDEAATQILAGEAFWVAIEAKAAEILRYYGAKPATVRNRTQALMAYNMWVQTRFPTAGLDEVWLLENLSEPWFTKIEPRPLPTARS